MLEYKGKQDDDRRNLERLVKDSVITGNKQRADILTTWVYQVMYHNAERVNNHEITLSDGWLNHKALCHECTDFGIKRGEEFEKQEFLSIVKELESLDNEDEVEIC